jgi:hypothetical protein
MCDHGHHGGGGGGSCARDNVATFEYGAEGMPYNMDNYIDKVKVVTLNELVEGSGASVFKPWEERRDRWVVLVCSD